MTENTRRLARRAHRRAGLTLVEIMVVIAILGTLMAVVAVNVLGYMDEANAEATKLQIKRIEEGLIAYAAKHKGRYPKTSDGLDAAKKYFPNNAVPRDAWGYEFQYFSPGTQSEADYEIISLGKDGQEGGQDADADIRSWEIGLVEED